MTDNNEVVEVQEKRALEWNNNALCFAGAGVAVAAGTVGVIAGFPEMVEPARLAVVSVGSSAATALFGFAGMKLQPPPDPNPLAAPLNRTLDIIETKVQ